MQTKAPTQAEVQVDLKYSHSYEIVHPSLDLISFCFLRWVKAKLISFFPIPFFTFLYDNANKSIANKHNARLFLALASA